MINRTPPGIDRPVYAPLLGILDSLLLKPEDVAQHWRLSRSRLSGLRQEGKGLPFFKLVTGAVRYRASDVIGSELVNTHGPLTLQRVLLAVSACSEVAEDDRVRIMQHLRAAFPKQE